MFSFNCVSATKVENRHEQPDKCICRWIILQRAFREIIIKLVECVLGTRVVKQLYNSHQCIFVHSSSKINKATLRLRMFKNRKR